MNLCQLSTGSWLVTMVELRPWRSSRISEEVPTHGGVERFEAPVVEDEQVDASKGFEEAGMAAISAGEREVGEEPGYAFIEHRAIVACRLVAEGTDKPAFAHACGTGDDQIEMFVDEGTFSELCEEGAIEPARRLVVDIFDAGVVTELGKAQSAVESLLPARGGFVIQKQSQPLGMGEILGLGLGFDIDKGLGHRVQTECMHLIESGMGEHICLL